MRGISKELEMISIANSINGGFPGAFSPSKTCVMGLNQVSILHLLIDDSDIHQYDKHVLILSVDDGL
jgi:hypothetical protein